MSTAFEVATSMAEKDWQLDGMMKSFALTLRPILDNAFCALIGPKRKRWDQYGAYHRRQQKKFIKKQLRFNIEV